jgi:hypothetical protein
LYQTQPVFSPNSQSPAVALLKKSSLMKVPEKMQSMEDSCYHFFWAIKLPLFLCLVTLWSVTIGCVQIPPGIQFSKQDIDFSHRLLSLHQEVA